MTETRPPLLAIDWEELDRLTTQKGWTDDGARARGLGISYQAFNHVRKGRNGPGALFIHSVLSAFGDKVYSRVFKAAARDVA